MENKRGKSKQEYQEEIARLVETGKKLMTEAEEIISSHSQTRKASNAKTSTPQASHAPQGNGARFGLFGNLCALLMGHKLASWLFGDDKPRHRWLWLNLCQRLWPCHRWRLWQCACRRLRPWHGWPWHGWRLWPNRNRRLYRRGRRLLSKTRFWLNS